MKSIPVQPENELMLEKHEDTCRILIIDLSKNFGGANTRVLNLMSKLPRNRIALAALENSPVAIEAKRAGLRVFIVGKNKSSWKIIPGLVSVIRSERIQVLDAQNPQSKFWGSISALLTGTALVSTLNSWYADEHGAGSLRGILYAILELGTNFSLNRYIVVSKSIYKALRRWGIPTDKIDVIHNAVEAGQPPSDGRRLIESLKLPHEMIALVAVGRLTWAKGYEDLIQAIKILIEADGRIRCLIAGDGELREKLGLTIMEAGLSRHVFLLGHLTRENVLSLIAMGDIFVMPSRSEGTPIALLEAAMLRKPIVATAVGGIPELVRDQEDCILVQPNNPHQLAGALMRLIKDRSLAERLGDKVYRRVSRDFSLDTQATATIQSYNKALQTKSRRM
jgi:glycosyltransferase involved in cell wall biosynthesis